MVVTSRVPGSVVAWAISTATTPAPTATGDSGGSMRFVITLESHGADSANPGTDGTAEIVPVEMTTVVLSTTSVTVPSLAVTSTRLLPTTRPVPRIGPMLLSTSHLTCHQSSTFEIMASPRFNDSARSIRPVTASPVGPAPTATISNDSTMKIGCSVLWHQCGRAVDFAAMTRCIS